jgi:hypothetical protein
MGLAGSTVPVEPIMCELLALSTSQSARLTFSLHTPPRMAGCFVCFYMAVPSWRLVDTYPLGVL